ncbi:MAG: hypothetical protein HC788_08180 [Sphingopyxis sp.]|nr:hypothetical protein [Sphingopyxis sp.]
MSPQKLHLINLARKALFQRAKLKRSVGGARSNFAPAALKDRAQQRVAEKVGAGAAGAEAALRKYSLPLGIAAGTGLLFAFRRPWPMPSMQ